MAKWSDRLVDRVVDRVAEKAGWGTSPMAVAAGGVNIRAAAPAQLAGPSGTAGTIATLLARDPSAFGGGLGPAYPLGILPLDPVNPGTGRADPRKWQYEVAWNLDLQGRLAQWNILSSAAVQIDIFSRAIAIRTADVTKMSASWQVSPDAVNTIMADNNITSSEAAKIARKLNIAKIDELNEFWENPYPMMDESWESWITEFLWQRLVYDGVPVHPHYTLGGKLIGFDIIEASTIKRLLDDDGAPPRPPNPAFQQILFGFPRGEFLASPDKDGQFYLGGEYRIQDRDQLSYFVVNKRTNSPYGISPVEMALQIGNVYVERLKWLQAEYAYGTTARGYIESSTSEMSQQSFAEWNRILNGWFEGQTNNRQQMTVLPDGFKSPTFTPQMDEKFKSDFDEMLIKRTAGFFGITPSQFGVIPRAGLGGGKGASEGAADETETVSSKPQNRQIEAAINSLARRYQGATRAVTFTLTDDEGSEDRLEAAKSHQVYFSIGALTANDMRKDLGLPDYEFPEADIPMIVTAQGPVPLSGVLAAIEENKQNGSVNAENPSGPGTSPKDPQEDQPQVEEGTGGSQEVSQEGPRQDSGGTKAVGVDAGTLEELRDFTQFVKARTKRGNWRAFDFSTLDESVAESLNEKAYFIVKGASPQPENLFTHFVDQVERLALGDNTKGTRHNSENVPRIAAQHHAAITAGLAVTGVDGAISAAIAGSPVHGAVVSNVGFDSSALHATYEALYSDAATAARETVENQLGYSAPQNGIRLQALLAQVTSKVKGVEDTTLTHIMNSIQEGVNLGESAAKIRERVLSVTEGMTNRQASIIALTESNRAYSAAYVDAATAAGITQMNWVLESDDPCKSCQELAAESPYSVDSLPAQPDHPNCQCIFDSVV